MTNSYIIQTSKQAAERLCEEVRRTIVRFATEHTKILGTVGGTVLIYRFERVGVSVVVFKNSNRIEILTNKECEDFGIASLPGTRLI